MYYSFQSILLIKCYYFCIYYFTIFFQRIFLFFLFFNFTILYWFCHISTWICHRYTRVPHPETSSLLLPHTIPLGRPSAPAPSIQYRASNLDWRFVSYMILYMFQCHSPKSSHPLPLPQSPKDCSGLWCRANFYVFVHVFVFNPQSVSMWIYVSFTYGFSLYTDLGKITYVPVFIQLLYLVNLCLSAKVFWAQFVVWWNCFIGTSFHLVCLFFGQKRDLGIAVMQCFYHIFFYPVNFTFQDNPETIHKESYKQFLHSLVWVWFWVLLLAKSAVTSCNNSGNFASKCASLAFGFYYESHSFV